MALPLILDTDLGSDVDDALALAYALRQPALDLQLVTTVSEDTVLRARLASHLCALADREEVEVAAGLSGARDRPNWGGHEGEPLLAEVPLPPISERGAVEALLATTAASRCALATIGMQSNVAAALAADQQLPERIELTAVMGGVFGPARRFDGPLLEDEGDHNLDVDRGAALHVLNAGLPLLYVPLDVTLRAPLLAADADRLRDGDELCQALARLIDVWAERLQRSAAPPLPTDVVAFLHDPLTVACLADRSFVEVHRKSVRAGAEGESVRTLVDDDDGAAADVVVNVDARAFVEHWLVTVLGA
ncbi:MAG: nucleoside hydrolase [Egibacteraceae bacterium]